MIRLNKTQINYLYRNAQDIKGIVETASDVMFGVCPFTIILGALNTTEAGYKPPNLIVNNYTNFNKVFTGRESILCVWDDCYDLDQVRTPIDKGGDETNNYGIVKVRQYDDGSNGGNRFYGRLTQSAVATSFKPNSANDTMTQMGATKTVSLIFEYNKNERLFDEITNNIYKMWVIPELFKFYDSNNHRYVSTDRQWYYLESCLIIYNAKTKNPEILQATFSSVNDVIAKSGLAIDQYIQINAPGDRCCFPTVNSDGLIVCDEELLKYKPITHIQISLFGNVAFSSIVFMGRNCVSGNADYKWKIEAPRFIFPHKYQASSYDELFVNAVPETNYYLMIEALPVIYEGFENWKDNISSTYNAFMSKQYEGYIVSNITKTDATNQDTRIKPEESLHYQYWDPRFLNDNSVWPDTDYSVVGSEYYNINPNLYDSTIKFTYCGETAVKLGNQSEQNYSISTLNITTFFTHKQFYQLPIEVTQTTPVAWSSLPVIGSFINFLSLGLPFGFRLTSNLITPRIPAITALYSCSQYDFLVNIFGTKSNKGIPFDVFRKDTTSDIYSMCGTTSQTTSLCFNLSNKIVIKPTKIDGSKNPLYLDKETIDSVKLGQISKDKTKAYLIGGLLDLERLSVNSGFIIDSFAFQAIGQVPYRITFYSQTDNPQGNLDNKNSVWTGIYKTLSSASQNTRQWTNFMILSNPQYNFKDTFYYPQNVVNAPTEGEFNKVLDIGMDELLIKKSILTGAEPELINYMLHLNGTVNNDGYVSKLSEDSVEETVTTFFIDDLDLGLEQYIATKIVLTSNDIFGKIYTQDIYEWGTGSVTLSSSGDYFIYYIIEGGGYPFYAQDPGSDGNKFNLKDPVIASRNFTILLDKDGEDDFSLEGYNNILNNDWTQTSVSQGSYKTISEFSTDYWPYKGEYLKTHLNLDSHDFWITYNPRTGNPKIDGGLNYSYSGLNIYFKQVSSPTITFKKTRDEANKRWKIEVVISLIIQCNGDCLMVRDWDGPIIENRDLFYHNIWYYLQQQGGAKPMYYGVTSSTNTETKGILDSKVVATYHTKTKE